MNKNYIAELMKDNDLKIGEEFGIDECDHTFKFDEYYNFFIDSMCCNNSIRLTQILTGKLNTVNLEQTQEYVEVTNDVPRFTEIEVRDCDKEEWESKLFLFKYESVDAEYPYIITNKERNDTMSYAQARMLKPSEPEFKEGELIEVSNDGDYWCKREFVRSEETVVTTVNDCGIEESNWKWIRKIEGK